MRENICERMFEMTRKKSFEDVKSYIESFDGYILLSNYYNKSDEKLIIKCKNKHTFEMTFGNFKSGKRCFECKRGVKWNIEKVNLLFEEKGLTLIEDKYLNNSTKMKYICKTHVESIQETTLANLLRSKKGCKYCAIEIVSNLKRLDINSVIKNAKLKGFELLNPEDYSNVKSILRFSCSNDHILETSYENINNLSECKICKGICINEQQIKEFIEKRGYVLLKFINTRENISVKCPNNHITDIAWDSFKKGQKCTICTGQIRTKYTYEMAYDIFKEKGMILLSENFKTVKTPMLYKCVNGHFGEMQLHTVLKGSSCHECGKIKAAITRNKTFYENGSQKTSKQQKYIYSVIGGKMNYPVGMYSLDVAFPDEKIYLEYDGGGHDLSVKLGEETKDDFERKHLFRSIFLSKQGWREIRIISKKNLVPSERKLQEMITYANNLFNSGRTWIKFDFDKNKIYTSVFKREFDFGELKNVNKFNQ